ncbi:MAG: transaldolase [Puniceicoccales bacterium]|jgi:transaldolase|nr:transaldolase [Puniceicoccales bacterium]
MRFGLLRRNGSIENAKMSSSLEQLRQWSVVVADTGDFEQIQQFHPQDATTNPTLILKASQQETYREFCRSVTREAQNIREAVQQLLVHFGLEILKLIPGRVSIEVDARLSFDVQGTVNYAKQLITGFSHHGINRERILIKIAATWEGIQAAQQLEKEGIHTNLTLIFSLIQAAACAEANVQLISPFIGRILDWHQRHSGVAYDSESDPGVLSVRRIFNYYKRYGYKTRIMGASFRNTGEILALAGCDLLTISPKFLAELQGSHAKIIRKLYDDGDPMDTPDKLKWEASTFRLQVGNDAMACEKLHEGIRQFCCDTEALEKLIQEG